jgi:hypothetical protein
LNNDKKNFRKYVFIIKLLCRENIKTKGHSKIAVASGDLETQLLRSFLPNLSKNLHLVTLHKIRDDNRKNITVGTAKGA